MSSALSLILWSYYYLGKIKNSLSAILHTPLNYIKHTKYTEYAKSTMNQMLVDSFGKIFALMLLYEIFFIIH